MLEFILSEAGTGNIFSPFRHAVLRFIKPQTVLLTYIWTWLTYWLWIEWPVDLHIRICLSYIFRPDWPNNLHIWPKVTLTYSPIIRHWQTIDIWPWLTYSRLYMTCLTYSHKYMTMTDPFKYVCDLVWPIRRNIWFWLTYSCSFQEYMTLTDLFKVVYFWKRTWKGQSKTYISVNRSDKVIYIGRSDVDWPIHVRM